MIYDTLDPATRQLVDLHEEQAWKFGMARDDHNRQALELAREDALIALRDDARRALMEQDSAGHPLPLDP